MAFTYTNSDMVDYVKISPYKNVDRIDTNTGIRHTIKKVTWHHAAGVVSVERLGEIESTPGRNMSSTYGIGYDARVGRYLDEKDRPWTSSSRANDFQAVTIEISNSSTGGEWPISDKVMAKAIALTVDICKRNGIKKLVYTGDSTGNFTFHKMFAATACLPVERTEVLTACGWVSLDDIKIRDSIATVQMDDLSIRFSPVLNKVPYKTQDTYITSDFEGTSDHRVMFFNKTGRQFIGQYKDVFDRKTPVSIPNAGYLNSRGMDMSTDVMTVLVAVNACGEYLRDEITGSRCGILFKFKNADQLKRTRAAFNAIGLECRAHKDKDGSRCLVSYDDKAIGLCYQYLGDTHFVWKWINLSQEQANTFINLLQIYDNGTSFTASTRDVDIVQAIAAMNGIGSKTVECGDEKTISFEKETRRFDTSSRQRRKQQTVSCVTVESGFILIRQNGRTTITGNCPGPYIEKRANEIVAKINTELDAYFNPPAKEPETVPDKEPEVVDATIKIGSLVTIASNAVYYSGASIPSWVKADKWYVSSMKNNRVVLGYNEARTKNIQSPVDKKYLTPYTTSTTKTVSYIKKLNGTDLVYKDPYNANSATSSVGVSGSYTIVAETTVDGVKYGKLKSGIGWVNLTTPSKVVDTTIHKGDRVRVLNNIQYNGKTFKVYCDSYYVLEVKNDRVVISSDGKNVTAAVNAKNLEKLEYDD